MSGPFTPNPSPDPVLALIDGFRSSKAMFVAVSLGVFDALSHKPASAADLAGALHAQTEPLERLLDTCVGLGLLFKQDSIYKNEPVASAYLCRDSAASLTGYILYSDKILFQLWQHLENGVRTGEPQWRQAFHIEGSIFDHFFRTDQDMRAFLEGMHGFGILSSHLVVAAFDLSRFKTFVDLGGATGHLAIAACEKYPDLKAILFDLPQVIDAVAPEISRSSVGARIELRRGDFFVEEQIPQADLFGLGRILHDWADRKVHSLLQAIYQRLPSDGGILLSEKLLNDEKTGPVSAQLQSLNMLVCTEGRERSLKEYRSLLESAGFTAVQGHVTGAPLDAVFAVKP